VSDTPDWPETARVVRPEVFDQPRPPRAPTLGKVLRPLVPLFGLDALTAVTVGMLPPILPLVAADWTLSPVEVGLVNTVYAIGRLGGAYPASLVRARWGTRAAIFLGLIGLVAGSLLCAAAPRFSHFLLARLVMGIGASLTFLAIFAELLESAPTAWRGRLANGFEATSILSLALGGALAALLAETAGWRWAFVSTAAVMLPCVLAWRPLGGTAGRSSGPAVRPGRAVSGAELRAVAPIFAASLAMAATWTGLFYTLVPIVGHDRYGLDSASLGLALSAGYVAELVGLLAVGLVIDRMPREPLFLGGAVSVALGALVLAVGGRAVTFVSGLVLVGGGFAVWMIPATVLTDRAGTPIPPAYLAGYRVAIDSGMILGPLVLGLVAEAAGERVAVGCAGLFLLGGAILLATRRPIIPYNASR
jgi:MFS family permease